ncbi:MAG: hypothetical protein HY719_00325 [Planctomycetes bacterium]|nr:hypothetical protein [Planctomycetota bacterium]
MALETLRKRYMDTVAWITRHPHIARKLHEFVAEELVRRRCTYEGVPMPIALVPILLEPEEHDLLRRTSETLAGVISKVVRAALTDERVRRRFTFADVPFEWQAADPGFTNQIPLARLDALFDGQVLKFVEFNCDNPGGKGWTDTYEEIVAEVPVFSDVVPPRRVTHARRVTSAVFRTVMKCWEEFQPRREPREEPSVALVDYAHSGVTGDTEIVRDYFLAQGVHAVFCDPRQLRRAGGRLEWEGRRYNIVIRCLKAMELKEFPNELADYVAAATRGEVCHVNPFRSIIGGEKNILSVLSNPEFDYLLTPEEARVCRAHIPWTRACDEEETTLPDGQRGRLFDHLLAGRENLVLKPSRGYGGKGVIIGRVAEPAAWTAAVEAGKGSPDWVAQEYVNVPTLRAPVFKGETLALERKYFNLSPYLFGGEYVGSLGRISDSPVVNVAASGAVIPVYNASETV